MTEHHRYIGDIGAEDHDKYLDVPGWRIWSLTVFAALDEEYKQGLDHAIENPESIFIAPEEGRAHGFIDEKLMGFTMPLFAGSFDAPVYILEPLTEEQLEEYEPDDFVSPDELRELLKGV